MREAPRPPQPHLTIWETLKALARTSWLSAYSRRTSCLASRRAFRAGFSFLLPIRAWLHARFANAAGDLFRLGPRRRADLVADRAQARQASHAAARTSLHRGRQRCSIPLLPAGQFWIVAPYMFLAGLPLGGGAMLTRSLMADVVDEDEVKTGARRSGIIFRRAADNNEGRRRHRSAHLHRARSRWFPPSGERAQQRVRAQHA